MSKQLALFISIPFLLIILLVISVYCVMTYHTKEISTHSEEYSLGNFGKISSNVEDIVTNDFFFTKRFRHVTLHHVHDSSKDYIGKSPHTLRKAYFINNIIILDLKKKYS